MPIALFVGTNDIWSVPEGAEWALQRLPKDTDYFKLENWDHSSYALGNDMSYFDNVMKLLKKYNPLPDHD